MGVDNKLIIALDNMNEEEVKTYIRLVAGAQDNIKNSLVLKVNDLLADIGLQGLATLVNRVEDEGYDVKDVGWMIDGKWNDIPNTVANYLTKLQKSGLHNPQFVTIMANGTGPMIRKAVDMKNDLWLVDTKILPVTVFTSASDDDAQEVYGANVRDSILRLVYLGLKYGAENFVCSPTDATMLRKEVGNEFDLVTPGIRLEDDTVKNDDQNRVDTPAGALKNGSTHLVVWRPITKSEEPMVVIERILTEMGNME